MKALETNKPTPWWYWVLVLGVWLALVGAMIFALVNPAAAQTSPLGAGFCGWDSASLPRANQITSGAAYQTATVSGSAFVPTIPTIANANVIGAIISVRVGSVMERHDGTAPTSVLGMNYGLNTAGGGVFMSCGSDLSNLQIIASSGTANAVVDIYYYINGR